MRVKLINQKSFVDEILAEQNLSLRQLAKKLKINYSNLKQCRRDERTFTKVVFDILINISHRKEYWLNNKKELDDNWGGVKGGTASARSDLRHKRIAYARKFRKFPKVNIILNEFFCEFYGILLGDGCISKYIDYEGAERYVIQISCNKLLDSNFLKNLKLKLKEEYNLYSYYYEYKDRNICVLSIKNKSLCLELNKSYGVPIGVKYDFIHLSEKILDLHWNIKKFTLRGLFDTDGCILANKRENYRYPWIVITSKSKSFRDQLITILRRQGYPAYNTGQDVCVRGIANVKRWFADIGSSNSRNIKKYEHFLKHGNLPARLLNGPVG